MRFIEKTIASYLYVNGRVNTYQIKSVFLLSLHFSADSSRCSWMLQN